MSKRKSYVYRNSVLACGVEVSAELEVKMSAKLKVVTWCENYSRHITVHDARKAYNGLLKTPRLTFIPELPLWRLTSKPIKHSKRHPRKFSRML